ncbi:MtrB/PioB family outer membrane beta-barrel protein [Geotalea sp. SG265]|uniref:MtrB/PioB family outer membrane beta-barrel protein n=1 Tax=Geotalea sp. SG265 TaxID=2922867 RepID=UPI001FAF4E13
MINLFRSTCLLAATFVSLHLAGIDVLASEYADLPVGAEDTLAEDIPETVEELDEAQLQEAFPARPAETHTVVEGHTGYRFLTIDNYGGRAAKYNYLHSGMIGGASYNRLGQDLKLSLDGTYLNDNDYFGDLNFDYAGDYRFHLRTESLFHNTTGENLFSNPFQIGRADVPGALADYIPHQNAPLTGFGVRTEQDTASLRYKIHDFPLHVNVGYWRMVKEGTGQIRFADIAFEGAENNFFAVARPINRETHEGKIGFDTHLGPIDIIYNFQIRQFTNSAGQLRDVYAGRSDILGVTVRNGGLQEHNEEPDSRYMVHTVKLHTSLAGGLVGAASYTYGKRDNLSRLNDTAGADRTSARLDNVAGDLVYTPVQELSLGLKYRRQEVDNNNPTTISNIFFIENPVSVRPSIGTEKDLILASVLYRPTSVVTIKGEYKGEFLHRDLTHFSEETLNWYLNENEETHKGTVSIIARPVRGLRMTARYGYTSIDHPSYGSSFARKHEGELTSSYIVSGKTGFTASYRNSREENDEIRRRIISSLSPLSYSLFPTLLAREKSTHNLTGSIWFKPSQKLTITANYGYLQYDTDQVVMFQISSDGNLAASDYKAVSHLYSLSSTYQFTEKADVSLTLQEVHSLSEFRPENKTFSGGSSTSGISELSHSKTFETSFSARGNYRVTKNLVCSLEYMLQDYYDKFNSTFDGTVHSVTAYVSAKW